MAFASFDRAKSGTPSADINMVPLIDVMLVLLVIFIVAAPMLQHTIPLDLPKESAQAQKPNPMAITIGIDEQGTLYWNEQPMPRDMLQQKFRSLAASSKETEIRLHADQRVAYGVIAGVLADAQRAGLNHIAFMSDPSTRQKQ